LFERLGISHRYRANCSLLNLLGNKNLLDSLFSFDKQREWPKVQAPPNFVVPEPQPLTITKSTNLGGLLSSSAGLAIRLATGAFVLGWKVDTIFAPEDGKYALQLGPFRIRDSSSILDQAAPPEETIILFDNESSPTCKRVREMMNLLDVTYECRPVFGSEIDRLPRIVDPNIDETISGDDEIIEHLLKQYGPPSSLYDRKALWPITFKEFALVSSQLAIILRGKTGVMKQTNARPDNANMKPIELWAYECSPFVRPVKEKLSTLGLPHVIVSCSRGSRNRDKMIDKVGRFQVPFIVDDNTGIEMFEGAEIVDYLEAVYTVSE
jgi:glutathione S-transferase